MSSTLETTSPAEASPRLPHNAALSALRGIPRSRLGGNRFRVLDLAVLASAMLLVVQAPLSVAAAAWVPNLEPLPRIAIAGLLVGYLIERTRLPGVLGLPLGVLLGIELLTFIYAQVAVVGSLAERVDWLGGRAGSWLDTVAGGGVSNDP